MSSSVGIVTVVSVRKHDSERKQRVEAILGDRLTSQAFYIVKDLRKRTCRKCRRDIPKGEYVKRSRTKNVGLHRGLESVRSMWLCQNCYTDAQGNPIAPIGIAR